MSATADNLRYLSPEALAAAIAQACGHGRDRRSAGTWTTYCPVHEADGGGSPDLEVTVKNGKVLVHCQSRGCSQESLIDALKDRGVWPDRPERRRLTRAEFAAAKKLPVEFLQKHDVVEAESYHQSCLHFLYRLEDGSPAPRFRVRVAMSGPKKHFWNRAEGAKGAITAYGLHRLKDARADGVLALVEGESDSLTLWFHDVHALGFPGASTVPKLLTHGILQGIAKLVVSQEPGKDGQKFRDDIIAKLRLFRWSGKVRVVHWPDDIKDPSGLHCRNPEAFTAEFQRLVAEAELIDLTSNQPQQLAIDADEYLPLTTAAAWEALRKVNDARTTPRLYRYAGGLVRVELDDKDVATLRRLDEATMRAEMVRASLWLKKEIKPATPTRHQVEDVLQEESPPLPVLRQLATVPLFAADGTLISAAGFYPTAGILYVPEPGLSIPPVPTNPSTEDVLGAYNLISEMTEEFPFVAGADRAHAIALLILPFVRPMIVGLTPIHGFEAPKPRTGKGLLLEQILYVGVGTNYAHYGPPPKDRDEVRKAITSALADGNRAILWDNIRYMLDSAEFATAVTTPLWSDRILGRSGNLKVNPLEVIWVTSANNPSSSDEIAKRTIRIRLDAGVPNPEDREFKKELPQWVRERCGALIGAALTLAQNWIAKGMPAPKAKPVGAFEQWSRVIGGILETAGIEGFLSIRPSDTQSSTDRQAIAWSEFVARWRGKHHSNETTVADLFEIAKNVEGLSLGRSDKERAQRTSFGISLNKRRDWVFAPMRPDPDDPTLPLKVKITFTGTSRKSGAWKLIEIE